MHVWHHWQSLHPFHQSLRWSHWGYLAVFILSVLETFPLAGVFVPGATAVAAAGFLARLHFMNFPVLIVFASAGAIVGDFLGYSFGVKYGFPFLVKYGKYFFFKEEYFHKTRQFVQKHAGKSIIIGRFHTLTRSFAPFLAGSSEIPIVKFTAYNIIGGISWAIFNAAIGFVFGESYKTVAKYVGLTFLAALVFGGFIIYLYRLFNKQKHIFNRYYLHALVISVSALAAGAKLLETVTSGGLRDLDQWVDGVLTLHSSHALIFTMTVFTNLFSPTFVLIMGFVFVLFMIRDGKWSNATLYSLALLGTVISGTIIKLITHMERPLGALVEVSGSSFPSGHVMMATVFILCIVHALRGEKEPLHLRLDLAFFAALVIFFVAFSRMYLHAHWASDVVGGFLLGLFWYNFAVLLLKLFHYLKVPLITFLSRVLD